MRRDNAQLRLKFQSIGDSNKIGHFTLTTIWTKDAAPFPKGSEATPPKKRRIRKPTNTRTEFSIRRDGPNGAYPELRSWRRYCRCRKTHWCHFLHLSPPLLLHHSLCLSLAHSLSLKGLSSKVFGSARFFLFQGTGPDYGGPVNIKALKIISHYQTRIQPEKAALWCVTPLKACFGPQLPLRKVVYYLKENIPITFFFKFFFFDRRILTLFNLIKNNKLL